MSTPTVSPALARYVAQVSDALADLPVGDRDDLLEDLRGHLEELFVENPDVDFETRLGTPSAYAAELRQAAGLPAAQGISGPGLRARLMLVGESPWGREVVDFVPQLRPAWWVLRAWGVFGLADWVLHRGHYRFGRSVLPSLGGSYLVGFAVLLGLVVVSVRIGRQTAIGVVRTGVVLANVALALGVLSYAANASRIEYDGGSDYSYSPPGPELVNSDGTTITNVFPYDAYGNPLKHVQLFDQNGNPINIVGNEGTENDVLHNVFPQTLVQDTGEVDANGNPVATPVPDPTIAAPQVPLPRATLSPRP